jgi:hypothetical protein
MSEGPTDIIIVQSNVTCSLRPGVNAKQPPSLTSGWVRANLYVSGPHGPYKYVSQSIVILILSRGVHVKHRSPASHPGGWGFATRTLAGGPTRKLRLRRKLRRARKPARRRACGACSLGWWARQATTGRTLRTALEGMRPQLHTRGLCGT